MWNIHNTHIEETFQRSVRRLMIFISILFCVLLTQLLYLQIIQGYHFQHISDQNRVQTFVTQAPRGRIFSSNGGVLVDNRTLYSVTLSKMNLDAAVLRDTVRKASAFIDIDPSTFDERIARLGTRKFEQIYIASDIPREMMVELKEHLPYLPGLRIVPEYVREYALGSPSAHLLGYVGAVTRDELEHLGAEGYAARDVIGKDGIEKAYDYYLRGKKGVAEIEVDARARQRRILREEKPQHGNDVYITIDSALQKEAEDCLQGKHGSIVALDPRTGKIRAMVSSPGFDPSQFSYPLSRETQRVFTDPASPMLNRSIKALYAPGSVFKFVTTIAALEEGKAKTSEHLECHGFFEIADRKYKCWNTQGHGSIDFTRAFAESCDVYYYQLGMRVGAATMGKYARMLGLGTYSQIDLPSEARGLIPDAVWKKKRWKTAWYSGDTVNMAIGQGTVLVTPLQIASMVAAVVNGGTVYRPYLVEKIVAPDGKIVFRTHSIALQHTVFSPTTCEFVKQAMKAVVEKGTGRATALKGISIGGKTGTAQNPHGKDHAWFVAVAQMDAPSLVVCVLVENGGHGGSVAAPLAKRIFARYFGVSLTGNDDVREEGD